MFFVNRCVRDFFKKQRIHKFLSISLTILSWLIYQLQVLFFLSMRIVFSYFLFSSMLFEFILFFSRFICFDQLFFNPSYFFFYLVSFRYWTSFSGFPDRPEWSCHSDEFSFFFTIPRSASSSFPLYPCFRSDFRIHLVVSFLRLHRIVRCLRVSLHILHIGQCAVFLWFKRFILSLVGRRSWL